MNMLLERLALISIAGVLVLAVSFLLVKYRKLHRTKEAELGKEDVIGRLFIRKLVKLQETVGKQEPELVFKRLNKMLKSFFSELYDIRRQFDYLELNEELGKKGISEKIRNDVIDLAMQMSQAEYSGQKITNIILHSLVDKSLQVINMVTGQQPEPSYEKQAAEAPPSAEEAPPEEAKPPAEEMKPPGEELKPEEVIPPEKKPVTGELPPEEVKKEAPPAEITPPAKEEAAPEAKAEALPEPKEELAPEAKKEEAVPAEKVEAAPEAKAEAAPQERKEEAPAVKMIEEAGQEIVIPADDKGKIEKMRRILLEAEQEIRTKDYDNAMESYTELKGLYDSLSPAIKAQLYEDIKRIISIYNTLLKEYKETLLGSG